MKRRIRIIALVFCGIAILSTATYSIGKNLTKDQLRNQKLKLIEEKKKDIKAAEEQMDLAKTDSERKKIENEMMADVKDQAELEIETGVYDYLSDFKMNLHTLEAGLTTLNNNVNSESPVKEKNKMKELKELYDQYKGFETEEGEGIDGVDYKEVNSELCRKINEIIENYS